MNPLELAIHHLERTHRALVAENPSYFVSLDRAARNRCLAIEAVTALLENCEPTPDQLTRLNRIALSGILSIERIRLARQEVREELASLGQEGRILSGYCAGST